MIWDIFQERVVTECGGVEVFEAPDKDCFIAGGPVGDLEVCQDFRGHGASSWNY